MNYDERVSHYIDHIYPRCGGWLRQEICEVIRVIGAVQRHYGVKGDIVEFGVHHGKFLLLLDALREEGETTWAVDLFDNHDLISQSPELEIDNLAHFKDNLGALSQRSQQRIKILQRDTLSFRPGDVANVKLFSIDADHSRLNAFNDLTIAQEAMVPGGVIALDDMFSPCWPEVTEALYDFLRNANRRLKPLLYYKGKLFLTTASEHRLVLSQYHQLLSRIAPEAVIRRLCGHDCLIMSWDGF